MEVKYSVNDSRVSNIIKAKKRLKNGIAYWSLFYLISFNIIHFGFQLSLKTTLPLSLFVLYINYYSFSIRVRDYNKQLLDLLVFSAYNKKFKFTDSALSH